MTTTKSKTELVPVPRYVRTDPIDDTSEILTLVQIDGRDGYYVEICSGPKPGDDFVGLFDLDDGSLIDLGNCTWERVRKAPKEIADALLDWETGTYQLTALPE
jgi:hypothetical protein